MLEPKYMRPNGPVPLSQCTVGELVSMVNDHAYFVPTPDDHDLNFGKHYAARLLQERLP